MIWARFCINWSLLTVECHKLSKMRRLSDVMKLYTTFADIFMHCIFRFRSIFWYSLRQIKSKRDTNVASVVLFWRSLYIYIFIWSEKLLLFSPFYPRKKFFFLSCQKSHRFWKKKKKWALSLGFIETKVPIRS